MWMWIGYWTAFDFFDEATKTKTQKFKAGLKMGNGLQAFHMCCVCVVWKCCEVVMANGCDRRRRLAQIRSILYAIIVRLFRGSEPKFVELRS